MRYRQMNWGDLQNLREVLSLDYKDVGFFLGSTKKRGPLNGSAGSAEPIESRELALLVRLLTQYPMYAVIGPRLSGPDLVNMFSDDFYNKYTTNGIVSLKSKIIKLSNLDNPSYEAKDALAKAALQLLHLYETGGALFVRIQDHQFSGSLPALGVEEKKRAAELEAALQKKSIRKGLPSVHPGKVSIILGKSNYYSGYNWARDEQVNIPQVIQRLAVIVRRMIFDLGREGVWRYLLIVDEDAFANGQSDGLISLLEEKPSDRKGKEQKETEEMDS